MALVFYLHTRPKQQEGSSAKVAEWGALPGRILRLQAGIVEENTLAN